MAVRVLVSFAIATLLGSAIMASAGEFTQVIRFSPDDLALTRVNGYDLAVLRDYQLTGEIGEPLLPSVQCFTVIPPTAELKDVQVLSSEVLEISGEYSIHPSQAPRPISSQEAPPFTRPDQAIYSSPAPYPAQVVQLASTGSMGGYRIAGVLVRPLQYLPSEKKLRLHTRVELRLIYREGAVPLETRTVRQTQVFGDRVRRMVLNPVDVDTWAPPCADPKQGTTEYAIVTSDAHLSTLQPFADWKTKKGIPTEIKTISWIESNYGGNYDTQENIREFLKDYYANHGLIWVLLAGDISVVPHRIARVIAGPYTGWIPCDLYFSDLDGNWDFNNNHIWGEPGDSVDMYADVYLGRASIENATQASTFLDKVFTYEKNPPTDYLKKICLPAVMLWSGYYGDVVNDAIAGYTPTGWQDTKLYESQGTLSRTALRNNLNSGYQFCHGAAHGDPNGWYYWSGMIVFNSQDAYGLTNGNRLTVVNSIACISGGFDQGSLNSDCLAENFVTNPNGGAVAAIMNSREGWGTPPVMGPSEKLDAKFYSCLFWDHLFRIGETHASSKDFFVPNAQSGANSEYWRWCVYELNLFGDPEMPMWTEVPESMTVDHPTSVAPGPQSFAVTLTDSGTPIEDGLVCVMNSTVYEHGFTNASGQVTFSIDPAEEDTLSVTATAYNYYPYEGECLVQVGVEELTEARGQMQDARLHQNSPNPLTGTTTIAYTLRDAGGKTQDTRRTTLSVYDLSGRLVRNLVDGEQEPGTYSVTWDGRDSSEKEVAGGLYFYKLSFGEFTAARKMVLLR